MRRALIILLLAIIWFVVVDFLLPTWLDRHHGAQAAQVFGNHTSLDSPDHHFRCTVSQVEPGSGKDLQVRLLLFDQETGAVIHLVQLEKTWQGHPINVEDASIEWQADPGAFVVQLNPTLAVTLRPGS